MSDITALSFAARDDLWNDIQQLTDEDMAVMTVCDPWTVRHLVAHLTALGNNTFFKFAGGMIKARGDFDKFINTQLQANMAADTAGAKAGFEKTLARTKLTPGPKYVMLGEYTVHGEDIRRALGRRGEHPAERLEPLAKMYADTKAPIDGKRRTEGLKFVATDGNWSMGEGPEIAGPGIDLVMAISGRMAALDSCEGDGVAVLRERS